MSIGSDIRLFLGDRDITDEVTTTADWQDPLTIEWQPVDDNLY